MSPTNIRLARKTGKLLRDSREAERVSLRHISKQCGLSVSLLIQIENGNLYSFDCNWEKFMAYSSVYAQVLITDLNNRYEASSLMPLMTIVTSEDRCIPHFLLKQTL
jgi:transcriptional regulator with XRE-family HTH domain